ncbi:hypothetical protein CK503_14160 [Aliifodinibius salipaludis]|uniref:Lipoprotein n=1 Tax=Fodinibius salipaludis TaxID=2032627 RepID=A0A2A2G871_9BACT|nr:hypothetical protein [Aliifodinibius salipaludis]PAU93059.1 hypothetical protein CK503_14160 [Aliifodinibius salipaludis]
MKFTNKMIPQLILSIGLIFMTSCNDSTSNIAEQDTVPEVPPANSMAMDLSIFDSSGSNSGTTDNQENYQEAAQTISDIQAMMNRNINPSLDLLKQADTTEAEQLNSTKWEWKFTNDEQEGRLIYEVRLVAERESNDEVKWDIFLSSSVLQNEKHFISGTSNKEVTEGVWTYHGFGRAGQPSQELAELDWQMTQNQDIEVEFTIVADNSFSGSKVNYNTEGSTRVIKLNNVNSEGVVTIEFNKDTNAGYIKSPDYNNGEKACWDSDFNNIDCSEI